MNQPDVPIWEKYTLTMEEAAKYFAIPPCPVHRRPAAGQRGIPGASVPRFAFWYFGHR